MKRLFCFLFLLSTMVPLSVHGQDFFYNLNVVAQKQKQMIVANKVSSATYVFKNNRRFAFEYDSAGNITRELTYPDSTSKGPGNWTNLVYDSRGQLVKKEIYMISQVPGKDKPDTLWSVWRYRYDSYGNEVYLGIDNKGWETSETFTRRYYYQPLDAWCIVKTKASGNDSLFLHNDSTKTQVTQTWYEEDMKFYYSKTCQYDDQGRIIAEIFRNGKSGSDELSWKYEVNGDVVFEKYIRSMDQKKGRTPGVISYEKKIYHAAEGRIEVFYKNGDEKVTERFVHTVTYLPNGLAHTIAEDKGSGNEMNYGVFYTYRK